MKIPLLLTATVNPQGMVGANFDPSERAEMYIAAIRFYLTQGCCVIFAENSGSMSLVAAAIPDNDNIEYVDVSGDEYDQSRGKGYNETIMLHKAVLASEKIREAGCFFKVTGRLKVLNILSLLKECESLFLKNQSKGCVYSFLADCKDHNLYQWLHMPINGHAGECRYWFANTEFFEKELYPRYGELNDYEPNVFLAEDLMLDVCRKSRDMEGCRDRFRTQARISGRGAHTLGKGWSFFYSTDNDSFALKTKCLIRQLLRWLLPCWRC